MALSTLKSRGQIINQTETVQLRVSFYNLSGQLADLDLFPTIKILQPSGNLALGPTSASVYRVSTGIYGFDYMLGVNASLGVWVDFWQGKIGNNIFTKELNFVVDNTQLPLLNSDGYVALGDDAPFNYSQNEIRNINKLLKGLKARLNSSGKAIDHDQFGNEIFVDCDIYDTNTLVVFIATSLELFNQVPYYTSFTFEDTDIITNFYYILVQGAVILALSSKALIERGREFNISDSGVSLTLPLVSDMLNNQYNTELTNHADMIKYIKNSMRPAPFTTGMLSLTSTSRAGVPPPLKALSMVRARQVI